MAVFKMANWKMKLLMLHCPALLSNTIFGCSFLLKPYKVEIHYPGSVINIFVRKENKVVTFIKFNLLLSIIGV